MPRKGITVYLPRELELRVERMARDQHRSASGVVAEAVKAKFERKDGGEEPARRQLSRVDTRLERSVTELLVMKETLLLFIRIWLEHNPPIDEELEESAAASAEARFERFIALVAQGLSPGRSVVEEPAANGEAAV